MKLFNSLINLGNSEKDISTDIRFLNGTLLILLMMVIPYTLMFYIFEVYDAAVLLTIGGVVYFIGLILSKKGHYTFTKYLLITNWCIFITYFDCAMTNINGVKAFYLLSIGLAYLLSRTKWLPGYTLGLATIGFYFSLYQDFIFPFDLNNSVKSILNLSLYPTAFVVLFFIIRFFKTQIIAKVQELNEKNQRLSESKEELSVQSQKLREANNQIEEFTYIASHDLKAPIRGIKFYSEVLQEDFDIDFPDKANEMLKGIHKLSDKMDLLVNDVMSFTKAEKSGLELAPVNLNELIDSVREDIDDQPNIRIEILSNSLPTCKVDIRGMKEAFINFITNAFKYNDEKEKRIEFNFVPSSGELLITDNGIGIAEKDYDKVFSFFRRVHGIEEYGGGSGAGLAIVKKIIERQGISISFESELGKGTTFKLDLSKVLIA